MHASTVTIKARLRFLVGMSMALSATIAAFSYYALHQAQDIAGSQLKERLIEGEKARLELTTRNVAQSLASLVADVTGHDAQLAVIARRLATTDEDPRVAEQAAAILQQMRR
jgi:hypothetical protein